MVLDGLGLDREKTLAYLRQVKPTYPQFEEWIKQQPGVKLDQASIAKLNKAIAGYNHDDKTRKAILGANNLPDNGAIKDAINLNNLDDWKEFHTALIT